MRRSICLCQPQMAMAGQVGIWHFSYQTVNALPKGAKLKFDLATVGRPFDWEAPRVSLRCTSNVIYGLMPSGDVVAASEVELPDSAVPQYEFILPDDLAEEETFTIVLGSPPKKKEDPEKGNRAQTLVQRRKQFFLYVDPKGKGSYQAEPEAFNIDIRGNMLENIRLIAPSYVSKNRRFDITVRFEDAYGNLTAEAPENTLVDLSYQNLRESLNWKLFVPETGFVILPNLYFFESGVYRICLTNQGTKREYLSAPIRCFPDEAPQLFWGTLHAESERVDAAENVETYLRQCRDDEMLNFAATSSFESVEETSTELWKLIQQNVTTFNEEDRFATLLGFQWQGEDGKEGLRQFIYSKDTKPLLRHKDAKSNTLEKVYGSHKSGDLISIPSFTMGKGASFDFEAHRPDFERVAEIYNAWGSSECTAKEGNPYPVSTSIQKGSLQRALQSGCRFGFVAGGYDDRGAYDGLFDAGQEQYSPGLTAIIAQKHTREAIFEALHQRRCYATTGERIILGLEIAGASMGSELSVADKPGLAVCRHVRGHVAGTDKLEAVELVRNGKVCHCIPVDGDRVEFEYDDLDPLEKLLLPSEREGFPFVYYYLRVRQTDGHMAWSSPIWIEDPNVKVRKGAGKKS